MTTEYVEKPEMTHEAQAAMLAAYGYRRVSNRYHHIARIDRPEWLQIMAKKMNRAVADFLKPDGTVSGSWADYYRRVYSMDCVVVGNYDIYSRIPGSDHDPVGYCPMPGSPPEEDPRPSMAVDVATAIACADMIEERARGINASLRYNGSETDNFIRQRYDEAMSIAQMIRYRYVPGAANGNLRG